MPLTLNVSTGEFFAYDSEEEQKIILKKLLSVKNPVSLDWNYNNNYNNSVSLKCIISWNRNDRIINVPLSTEKYVLENVHWHEIWLNV
jgi:hypothetical protein